VALRNRESHQAHNTTPMTPTIGLLCMSIGGVQAPAFKATLSFSYTRKLCRVTNIYLRQ